MREFVFIDFDFKNEYLSGDTYDDKSTVDDKRFSISGA